jgi:predicted methyltransferase
LQVDAARARGEAERLAAELEAARTSTPPAMISQAGSRVGAGRVDVVRGGGGCSGILSRYLLQHGRVGVVRLLSTSRVSAGREVGLAGCVAGNSVVCIPPA